MGPVSTSNAFEPRFLVVGAGSRGNNYARAISASTKGKIGAVAEIDPFKRAEFGRKYIWGDQKAKAHESFSLCEDFISYELKKRKANAQSITAAQEEDQEDQGRITGVFICTLDDSHAPIIRALAQLNLHIMCEKPLALSLSDCLSIKSTLEQYPAKLYSIGHVLRYSPHNILLRKLLCEEQVIGEVVSIEHTEPIEDIVRTKGWDRAETVLMDKLGEDWDESMSDEVVKGRSWYGRCVYEADNDVCDEQTVVIGWESDGVVGEEHGRGRKQAIFHMTYPTQAQCQRRGRIYGTLGEMTYDGRTITVHTFADGQTRAHLVPKQAPEVERSHGGGDWGLAGAFVNAVIACEAEEVSIKEAQWRFVGCDLEEIVRSHALVFAAEEARKGKMVVDLPQWEKEKYAAASSDRSG
ncbi:hypothetical protein DV736_g1793, partial [Chaetothyriales sp. CBS 134916]